MIDYDDTTSTYQEIYTREAIKYELTPAWRLARRVRLYAKVRNAYADYCGALRAQGKATPCMVETKRKQIWGAIRNIDGDTIFLSILCSVMLGFVCLMGLLAVATDSNGLSDAPLPKWAHAHGRVVTIDPSYLNDPKSENWFDNLDYNFCERMPIDGKYEITARKDLPDGGFQFTCSPQG